MQFSGCDQEFFRGRAEVFFVRFFNVQVQGNGKIKSEHLHEAGCIYGTVPIFHKNRVGLCGGKGNEFPHIADRGETNGHKDSSIWGYTFGQKIDTI